VALLAINTTSPWLIRGNKVGRRRVGDDAVGLGELTGMFAAHGGGTGTVKVAIETERGLLVASLRAAGCQVYAVNPKAVDRYRDRHQVARNKSDAADAMVLVARVLGEFGDDRTRCPDPASRRAYAGSAPITRESGKKRLVVAHYIRNQRLYDAVRWWAFTALSTSPGARAYYDQQRAAGDTHEAALRRLVGKLIGQLYHGLAHRVAYDETAAWPPPANQASPRLGIPSSLATIDTSIYSARQRSPVQRIASTRSAVLAARSGRGTPRDGASAQKSQIGTAWG
jgi:hypothetical protein